MFFSREFRTHCVKMQFYFSNLTLSHRFVQDVPLSPSCLSTLVKNRRRVYGASDFSRNMMLAASEDDLICTVCWSISAPGGKPAVSTTHYRDWCFLLQEVLQSKDIAQDSTFKDRIQKRTMSSMAHQDYPRAFSSR